MTQYITVNPKIMGGKPVIIGTRLPISRVLFLLKEGYTVEAVRAQYPHIPLKTLKKAIDELTAVVDTFPYATQVSSV